MILKRSMMSGFSARLHFSAALVVIVALALLSRAFGQGNTPLPVVDSPATSETDGAGSEPELPPMQMPEVGISLPLSVAEIRWCMSQEIGLQAMQPILGTVDAIDHYNELADDFNRHCSARQYSEADGWEAKRLVDGTREEIVADAIEEAHRLNDRVLTTRIQEMLGLMGYKLATDGVYTTQTKEAIQTFQWKVGMPADGLVSQRVLDRLQVAYMRSRTGREREPRVP